MDLARASLVLIRVLRTLINSIAKNLHKLQICLRFYSFHKKLDIRAKKNTFIHLTFFCKLYKVLNIVENKSSESGEIGRHARLRI